MRRGQVDIIHRLQAERALFTLHVNAGRTVKGNVARAAAQRADAVKVTPGNGGQATAALQRAANVVDIGAGPQVNLITADKAAVIQVIRRQLGYRPASNVPAVGQIVADRQRHAVARQQRTAAVQVARFHAGIQLRHQNLLRAAVRQGNRLRHQPDHIAGQQGHLLRRQRHAWRQAVCFAKEHAGVHQRPVLRLVIAVAVQIAVARQRNDLPADQLLLVVTIAKTAHHVIRILGELVLHIVAAEPLFLVGEARIGLHQITNVTVRM